MGVMGVMGAMKKVDVVMAAGEIESRWSTNRMKW